MSRKQVRLILWLLGLWSLLLTQRSTIGDEGAESGPRAENVLRIPYDDWTSGPWRIRLLPGTDQFAFSMYGCPGDLSQLKELIAVMREQGLGNGFDPGPSARASSRELLAEIASAGWPVVCYPGCADMQIKDGRCRLEPADVETMQPFRQKGLFCAVQLGEWGYYFHNLSCNEPWWHDVYGPDFDQFKHLMKPPGLAGYDTMPRDRRECYAVLRDYFLSRRRDMGGRIASVTGHSHYEAYAAEWGADLIGLELGENIAFSQSKIAFARGASRQWDRPWSIQVSPWMAGSCTTRGPLRQEGSYARGLDAGHSLSLYTRMWLHGWLAGTALVTPENSIAIFFEEAPPAWQLTSHGRRAAEVMAFTRRHDRGVPFTPVAVVLDHLAGYNAYQGRPWGILEPTPADREAYDLFQYQLFPGSNRASRPGEEENPERGYLCPTPFGEMFDVLLSSAEVETLQSYPVLLLAGEMEFSPEWIDRLEAALRHGSRLLIARRHAEALGVRLADLQRAGSVEILPEWINPETGRPAAIPNEHLRRLNQEWLPVAVEGDAVGYQVNRNGAGWVVELIHNGGVVKFPDRPARIDPNAIARVMVRPRVPIARATLWRLEGDTAIDPAEPILLGPGETVFVELVVPE